MTATSKERIEYIDLAKGVCILLVVIMHVTPHIGGGFPALMCLRMPLYYFLSGMFFRAYDGFSSFLKKKTDRLLIPFVAWYFIGYAIHYFKVLAIGDSEHEYLLTDLFLEPEFYNGSIWFLLSLFWCNLLYYFVHQTSPKIWIQGLLVLSFAIIGWVWSFADYHNFLYIGSSLISLPFFFIGRQMVANNLIRNEKNPKIDILTALSCLALAVACLTLPAEPFKIQFYLNHLSSGNPALLYVTSISLVILTLIICKYVKHIPYVSFLGRFSIIVLVTHMLLKNSINRAVRHLIGVNMSDEAFNLILLGVILALMAIIIPLCRRYLPYITAQKGLFEERAKRKLQTAA